MVGKRGMVVYGAAHCASNHNATKLINNFKRDPAHVLEVLCELQGAAMHREYGHCLVAKLAITTRRGIQRWPVQIQKNISGQQWGG